MSKQGRRAWTQQKEERKDMTLQRLRVLSIILPSLTFFGCMPGQQGPGGNNWGHMMGYGYGGGFMWIIGLLVVGAIIFFLVRASKTSGSAALQGENPLEILKKRYARGELDKEEFDRMKKDLDS